MHLALTAWAALLTFRAVAATSSVFTQQLCLTKLGTKSTKPVPSSTKTISLFFTQTSKVTVNPVSTITPAPTTTFITSTTTLTSSTTLPQLTDTVTITSTSKSLEDMHTRICKRWLLTLKRSHNFNVDFYWNGNGYWNNHLRDDFNFHQHHSHTSRIYSRQPGTGLCA